ncbi:PilZ domain-containing protein [Dickeya oryzae]|uniref:HD domain-containing phosphohydrolase n=1 Tax=Dickeya oryzae TaxID=1240404 RepID=UPI002096A1B2|nr:HD domain-containing phosphohydrolase [Dickeya oryzae]MCO7253170.1 PilZ domain-containing protein [Dickeya oryzae]UUE08896.1 PilZ domain-containing protein [Dickeya zeae]
MSEHYAPPPNNVIRSLIQHPHAISIYAKSMPYPLKADVRELSLDTSSMILEVEYSGADIEYYLDEGGLNFDLEALKGVENNERETYSLTNIPTKLLKVDSLLYRLECQLPDSVFIHENRGGIRIPFILGMQARAHIEIYRHVLTISGKLRNLSRGGCLVEIDLVESISVEVDHEIPGITIEFPNGTTLFAEGKIRHMRPFGNNGYAVIGIQFINLSSSQSEALLQCTNEVEREAAFRTGMTGSMVYTSPLFTPSAREKSILLREHQEREKRTRQTPTERGVLEVAHHLQIGLMYVKTRNQLPLDIFYDCVDTLLYLVKKDRKALLYALSFLRDEADWVRHAVQVSGTLADMLLLHDQHDPQIREAVLGALLHTMGKPLLINAHLPSLKVNMNPAQKAILRGHVAELCQKLSELGWEMSPVCREVIENANERLDGSGYPAGKQGIQLSPLIRLVSVIKTVNKLRHARNGVSPRTPLEAYRKIHDALDAYDKSQLVRYIQIYGPYPIGSLAKFSAGFLGWILDIDNKGRPTVVHLVKNLRFPDTNISSVVSKGDLSQVGKLVNIADPQEYELKVLKL